MIITLIKLIMCNIYSEHGPDDETKYKVQNCAAEIKGSHFLSKTDKFVPTYTNPIDYSSSRSSFILACCFQ